MDNQIFILRQQPFLSRTGIGPDQLTPIIPIDSMTGGSINPMLAGMVCDNIFITPSDGLRDPNLIDFDFIWAGYFLTTDPVSQEISIGRRIDILLKYLQWHLIQVCNMNHLWPEHLKIKEVPEKRVIIPLDSTRFTCRCFIPVLYKKVFDFFLLSLSIQKTMLSEIINSPETYLTHKNPRIRQFAKRTRGKII